jgi:histidyl-tRNA synthetase
MEYFVVCVDESFKEATVKITMKLRSRGLSANFSYKSAKLGKQLKQASEYNAKKCIIIGEEFKNNKLVIKDMTTGDQEEIEQDKFFAGLEST